MFPGLPKGKWQRQGKCQYPNCEERYVTPDVNVRTCTKHRSRMLEVAKNENVR